MPYNGRMDDKMTDEPTTSAGRTQLKTYALLYSYPTSDRYYRGQRGVRVEALNERDAIARVRRGAAGYGACPDAQIVRCKEVTR